ncbi:hypothetical protein NLJ89_g1217 [Agrocybe chaxingu]|uniref:beta-glucosidase n=1 Tax=Agrocybe chaxingu TaxID=84603 RepID=A0A9W8N0H3_9AGAR|nr:hypothetical protein NLJ89_g1217 [Agrocybe chaxingu]
MAFKDQDVSATLAKLNLPQKIKLLSGLGWWHTEPVHEAGIQSMRFSDGPNGVRGTRFFNGVPSSCFPASTGLGSSFDVELAHKVGEALGDECRAKSTHVLLAPTVNIQRSPLGGRGFESFSEDPLLNGAVASAYINGLQSKGVSATIKHFVANDQEFERQVLSPTSINPVSHISLSAECLSASNPFAGEVSERALREIYLRPFQLAVKDANPWAIMTATTGSIKAGLDLEMPGPSVMRGKALERALIAQKVLPRDIDERAAKVLGLLDHARASGIPFNGPEGSVDTPDLRQLLRTAAADSIVLLKNEKGLLPLTNQTKKIAVIGPNAKPAMTSGGGSARLLSTYTVSPLQGILAAAKEVGAEVKYTVGATSHKYLPLLDPLIRQSDGQPGAFMEFWNQPPPGFMKTDPDFNPTLPAPAWSTPTLGSNCIMIDGVDETKVDPVCWIRYSTKFTPDEDGDWAIGINVTGAGNVFLDGKIIIDLSTNPPPVSLFTGSLPPDTRTIVKGLKGGQAYDLEVRIDNSTYAPLSPFPFWGVLRAGAIRDVNPEAAIEEAVAFAKESDVAILVIGLNHDWETEGDDRADMELPGLTNRLVSEVLSANPNTVVINQSGTPVRIPWVNEAATLLQAFYGGNELGNGLADVLFGKVNPSGKLPLTFPKRLEDNPSYPSFGNKGQEAGKVHYNEGIFVGYRSYEIRELDPLFPFGFGLSYSHFEYSDLEVSPISSSGEFAVSFKIRNTGKIGGREVAQVYVSDPESSLPRALKELRGFAKLQLQPGESKSVKVSLDKYALSFYDERDYQWVAEQGSFGVLVGSSSADIRLEGETKLEKTFTWRGL